LGVKLSVLSDEPSRNPWRLDRGECARENLSVLPSARPSGAMMRSVLFDFEYGWKMFAMVYEVE
jgi:hypothetical protein